MTTIDADQMLSRARELADEYLDTLSWDRDDYDLSAIAAELAQRTHNGEPVVALVVDDPSHVALALVIGSLAVTAEPRGQLWDQLMDQLGDQLGGQLWDQLMDQLGDQLGGQLWGQLGGQLRDQLWGQLWGQIGGQLWGQIGDQLGGQLGGAYRCIWDAYRAAFCWVASEAAGIEHEFARQSFAEASRLGLWGIVNYGSLVVGITRPVAKRLNGVLHCEDGPAIRWGSWESWWWRGTEIPREWIESPDSVDPASALTWPQVEQRRALCEILGWARVLEHANARTIHADPDPEIGTLIEAQLPDHGAQRFLRVRCGTGREFALPVPPDVSTAREANAWTWGLSAEEYAPEVRT